MTNDLERSETETKAEHALDKATIELGETFMVAEPLTVEEDRRILRLIDWNLVPIMAMSYLFQFLDKSALGYTAILTLREDLGLSGLDYSWAGGIYYVGYLVASYPAAWLMIRTPVGKMIASSITVWGAILMLTALCFNPAGLLANRLFLGVAESAIAPGLAVMVSMWYKREEQPMRQGAWFMGNVLAGIMGGVTAYGLSHIQSIAAWKAIYLIFGAITVLWSAAMFFLLPDTPASARFLSKEDRARAIKRVEANMTGIKSSEWKRYQFLEALADVQVWLLVIVQMTGSIANGVVTNFGAIVIKGMGFSTLNTLLVQMIGTCFQGFFVITGMLGSTYLPKARTVIMAWHMLASVIGALMIRQVAPEHQWARFFGYCLSLGYSANFPMLLAMTSSNIGGFTKKTTANAMIFIGYCAGNIIGPQLFFQSEAPSYPSGFLAMIICFCLGFAACVALRFYLPWQNRRRDRAGGVLEVGGIGGSADGAGGSGAAHPSSLNLADKTDKEILQFRYLY
ncbi:major facilitator superfamily domain-containing protein [Microdochium bolleyi]|uniref:Major facilitator superfamily domain-containing protein n=1 Tax=Microdochium bolleyi TaxID=196109 RepID=A0A136IQZ7_9PEZI|nr:major facilitator superfamily domain-containing protein [Microdochium bolleyi]